MYVCIYFDLNLLLVVNQHPKYYSLPDMQDILVLCTTVAAPSVDRVWNAIIYVYKLCTLSVAEGGRRGEHQSKARAA